MILPETFLKIFLDTSQRDLETFSSSASALILPATVQKSAIRIFDLMVAGHKTLNSWRSRPSCFDLCAQRHSIKLQIPPCTYAASSLLPIKDTEDRTQPV
ncbi:hypothetical protein CDAR_319651 [Caerostris darwini]|uniref:Uncharacterized protein n=1 Tax=Caerostris darwini TaxID=1538125 RepID=A0AAV4M8E8_9ARAC|nr:hypothetical protein CDAR_319651 [Caerostris darwini]